MAGCNKQINPYASCGDISFSNEILLCDDCKEKDALKEDLPVTICPLKHDVKKDSGEVSG